MNVPEGLLLVALGGALGAPLRVALTFGIVNLLPQPVRFPWATLSINVSGSFLLGVLVWFTGSLFGDAWRLFLGTGVLGSYTTYSTFSVETLLLVERRHVARAVAYVAATVLCGLLAALAGMALGRWLN
jgi:fluoride exporter